MQSAMSLKRRPDETDDVMDIDDGERLLYDARLRPKTHHHALLGASTIPVSKTVVRVDDHGVHWISVLNPSAACNRVRLSVGNTRLMQMYIGSTLSVYKLAKTTSGFVEMIWHIYQQTREDPTQTTCRMQLDSVTSRSNGRVEIDFTYLQSGLRYLFHTTWNSLQYDPKDDMFAVD